jgi:uncharacterized membrane protein YhaH (DUF805 family)
MQQMAKNNTWAIVIIEILVFAFGFLTWLTLSIKRLHVKLQHLLHKFGA